MHIIQHQQLIPSSLDELWRFFSTPGNLAILTPPYLGFEADSMHEPIYEGQIIIHHIKPLLGFRMRWVTEITHVKQQQYFIDEQRFGPYKFWHHEHRFIEKEQGVLAIDKIHYELPFGPLGKLVNQMKVRFDLEKIFDFRQKKLVELFGQAQS